MTKGNTAFEVRFGYTVGVGEGDDRPAGGTYTGVSCNVRTGSITRTSRNRSVSMTILASEPLSTTMNSSCATVCLESGWRQCPSLGSLNTGMMTETAWTSVGTALPYQCTQLAFDLTANRPPVTRPPDGHE